MITREFIGIDIGSNLVGVAGVDESGNLVYCRAHRFTSEGIGFDGLGDRLRQLDKWADAFFAGGLRPGTTCNVGIEEPHVSRNRHTALVLGMAFGIIAAAAWRHGHNVMRFTPGQGKRALVGVGNATKEQVLQMARMQGMTYEGVGEQDAADAYGVALATLSAVKLGEL